MTLNGRLARKVSKLSDVAGTVAVIASLFFLAYEIRQSNKIARSTMSYELADNYSQLNEIVWTNPEVAELHVNIRDASYVPSAVEEEMLRAEIRRIMNVWGATETAYRNGHQTREQLDVMLDDLEAVLRRFPAMQPLWRTEFKHYPGMSSYEFYRRAERVLGN